MKIIIKDFYWRVYDALTGLGVNRPSTYHKTQREAVADATKYITELSKKGWDIERSRELAIKHMGINPAYVEEE